MYWEQNALAVAGYEDIATITESEEIQAYPSPTIHATAKRIEKRIFQFKWWENWMGELVKLRRSPSAIHLLEYMRT